ncbi:uncharacterized protein LOC144634970 [Oculina patagonica]
MIKITWIQIFATMFQLITSTAGLCNETNVGVRDELKVIPNGQMTASTNTGDAILGRLHGTSAWCPAAADATPYLQIDLGQKYVICGVEAQGDPGASFTTSFSLSTSQDDASPTFTDYVPTTQFNSATPNDGDAADFHELPTPVTARHIRFKPFNDSICLRVEVYGTPEGVDVTCNENNMTVQIDRGVHDGFTDPNALQLLDNACGPSFSNDSVINFIITLGTCGTTVVISTDGVKSFYHNEIKNTTSKEFNIICSYIRQPTEFTPASGSFSFAMNIFTDDTFTTPVPNSAISLGTNLYFKVDVQSSDSNTELHLTSCRATKTSDANDANNYTFITDGCETDDGNFISDYNCTTTDNFQTFTLSVFRFAGSTSGDPIYFHCDAVVCLISNPGSVCNTQCDACGGGGNRKRRTVGDYSRKDIAEAHLVLGPYTIIDNDEGNNGGDNSEDGTEKEEGPTEAIKDSENFPTTLVAVVCVSALVAIAIIIGLLVMVRLSKNARGPAVKDVTADLARDNLAFEDLEIKTLSIKSNEKPT